jgi:hypothetical protein
MADRYWILGTGTWDSTNTVNWSDSSGGLGGFSVPTAADNVFFDANSNVGTGAFTVTMANSPRVCNDFTASGLDGAMTLAGTFIGLTVSGSLSFPATNFTRTYSGTTTFNATTTGKTITTNGVSFPSLVFNGVGGEWTLNGAITIPSNANTLLTSGTLNLASYTLSTGRFNSTGSNIRTIAFGTGQMSVTGNGTVWETSTITNLSVSGSKTVNFTSVGSTTLTVNSGDIAEANALDFNVTGGTYAFRFGYSSGNSAVRDLNFTGFSGSWDGLNGVAVIYGNLTMSATMTTGASGVKRFAATSGTKTITSNGASLNIVEFNGVSGTWQLQDNMNVTQQSGVDFRNGTVDLNGQTLTTPRGKTSAGTKNITFNGGTLAITDTSIIAWYNVVPTGFTTTAGTGTGKISMTSASAKSFNGGGSTYNCTLNQGGAGALTITDSNTFSNITNTVQPASVLFTAGTTSTFTNFNLSGTSGNLITIGSVTAASHTLSKASGNVSSDFLSISQSTATGGAGWYAGANSTDGGNNSGWIFTAPPAATATGNFLVFF